MDNKKENLSISMEYDEKQTIPLALHEMHMARADRRLKHVVIGFASVIISLLLIGAYVWLQYDYTSTVETNGVYNLVDSQGNVLTSDISPDDVIRILEVLDSGEGPENSNP